MRVALASGLNRKQVASDFGIDFSTLSRCIQLERKELPAPTAQSDLEAEVIACAKAGKIGEFIVVVQESVRHNSV